MGGEGVGGEQRDSEGVKMQPMEGKDRICCRRSTRPLGWEGDSER